MTDEVIQVKDGERGSTGREKKEETPAEQEEETRVRPSDRLDEGDLSDWDEDTLEG